MKVTGKNIVNIPDFGADTPDTVKECYISKNICISAQEKADVSKSIWRFKALHKDGSIEHITDAALPGCFYATEENPIVSITYRAAYITSGAYKGIMVEYGTAATKYEPYKEQTLTLTSDRPLTKWDRLERREDIWGIAKQSAKKVLDGTERWSEYTAYNGEKLKCYLFAISDTYIGFRSSFCTHFKNVNEVWNGNISTKPMYGDHRNNTYKYFISEKQTVEEFKAWLAQQKEAGTPVELVYKTAEETWEPLPEEIQKTLNALYTNYPTTIISNSENAEMELTYVADTKNYTDRKIEQAVSAQVQNLANLLSLMPLSTQAAMIENDTNNILDMEVPK